VYFTYVPCIHVLKYPRTVRIFSIPAKFQVGGLETTVEVIRETMRRNQEPDQRATGFRRKRLQDLEVDILARHLLFLQNRSIAHTNGSGFVPRSLSMASGDN